MENIDAHGTQRTHPEGVGTSADRWVSLEEAAQLTGKTRGILYHQLVNHGKARKVLGPNGKWRNEVRLVDAQNIQYIGTGHNPQKWSGPVTEKTLDRLMRALKPIERSVDALW